MKRSLKSRFLAMLLAAALAVSMFTVLVFAATCQIDGCTCAGTCTLGRTNYEPYNETMHTYNDYCVGCGATLWINSFENHTFNANGVCTKCGYERACTHPRTRTQWDGCTYTVWCTICGEMLETGTEHGPFSYSAYEYYNETNHRRTKTCDSCGKTWRETQMHTRVDVCTPVDDTQHQHQEHCKICSTDFGTPMPEDHAFSYGAWEPENDTQHRRSVSCAACGYEAEEYAEHRDEDGDRVCDDCSFEMPEMNIFRVTVPVTLPLTVDENGHVHAAAAGIRNSSSAAVQIVSVMIRAENGWTIVPFETQMAHEKVDSNRIGFRLLDVGTAQTGSCEQLMLPEPRQIGKDSVLELHYDAVVSALSAAVTDHPVLSVVFVFEWA